MKNFTVTELTEIIEKHHAWLSGSDDGVRANLSSADLSSANLSSANLRLANLSFANLSFANLSFADLSSADLSSANLRSANLSFANLRSANLRFANLRFVNLRSANLRSANLRSAVGDMEILKTIQCDYWPVSYTAEVMQIGCQHHSLQEWWNFSDNEIQAMDSHALVWWRIWKPILKSIIDASPCEA